MTVFKQYISTDAAIAGPTIGPTTGSITGSITGSTTGSITGSTTGSHGTISGGAARKVHFYVLIINGFKCLRTDSV
jgi:hypothetical protein